MQKTKIEWTDVTWNCLRGTKGKWHCTKVSDGCKNCYAERLNVRFGGPKFQVGADVLRLDEKILRAPLSWKKQRMVFVCSMTDLFHESVPDGWIDLIFAVMALADRHTFQILTKRPERMKAYFAVGTELYGRINEAAREITGEEIAVLPTQKHGMVPGGLPLPNVWLGTSVENQEAADERMPILLDTPAAVRWVSAEPLLGEIDFLFRSDGEILCNNCCFGDRCDNPKHRRRSECIKCKGTGALGKLDWVVVGGESGSQARPMEEEWARSIFNQCKYAGVPFFFKQGSQANWPHFKDFDSFPKDLQVREYPNQQIL